MRFENAGQHQPTAGPDPPAEFRRQPHQHAGQNVGQHDIHVQLGRQFGGYGQFDAILDAVPIGVVVAGQQRLWIDIHRPDFTRAQFGGSHRQNP